MLTFVEPHVFCTQNLLVSLGGWRAGLLSPEGKGQGLRTKPWCPLEPCWARLFCHRTPGTTPELHGSRPRFLSCPGSGVPCSPPAGPLQGMQSWGTPWLKPFFPLCAALLCGKMRMETWAVGQLTTVSLPAGSLLGRPKVACAHHPGRYLPPLPEGTQGPQGWHHQMEQERRCGSTGVCTHVTTDWRAQALPSGP